MADPKLKGFGLDTFEETLPELKGFGLDTFEETLPELKGFGLESSGVVSNNAALIVSSNSFWFR